MKPTWVTANIFIYPVTGYVVDKTVDLKGMRFAHLAKLWCINILCMFISIVCEYFLLIREPGNKGETFLMNFCLVNAVVIFITVKYLAEKRPFNKTVHKIIMEIGQCTFGIYLIHILLLWKIPFVYKQWVKIEQNFFPEQSIGIFISCICVFVIAGGIICALRKIPVMQRIL